MNQAGLFIESEGDAWLERNRERLGERDLVSGVIEHLEIRPTRVLEIGCANGWRLARLRDRYGCEVIGIDPSQKARDEAAIRHGVEVFQDSAKWLPMKFQFDLVIYGFCLYLTDPDDWFTIVAQGDSVLADGGYLIIHDFDTTNSRPFARKYEHREGILSYHVDFAALWLAHPWYHRIDVSVAGNERITVLCKNVTGSIPVTL